VDLPDEELVRRLSDRDGPMGGRWRAHRAEDGACPYAALYPDLDCPWCRAEVDRRSREEQSPARPRA
jgi:hypothetical protein